MVSILLQETGHAGWSPGRSVCGVQNRAGGQVRCDSGRARGGVHCGRRRCQRHEFGAGPFQRNGHRAKLTLLRIGAIELPESLEEEMASAAKEWEAAR